MWLKFARLFCEPEPRVTGKRASAFCDTFSLGQRGKSPTRSMARNFRANAGGSFKILGIVTEFGHPLDRGVGTHRCLKRLREKKHLRIVLVRRKLFAMSQEGSMALADRGCKQGRTQRAGDS